MFYKTSRTALMQMERLVNNINSVTDKPKDATFKGGLQCLSGIVLCDTGTPKVNGKLPLENRVGKRPKMEVYGVQEKV
jgi:hypothetical protein